MDNFTLFYQIREIHGLLAGFSFLFVIISDLYGSLWTLGKLPKLNLKVLIWLHRIVFAGLGGLILTGLLMFSLNSEELLKNSVFLVKMVFVTILFWNAWRIGKEIHIPAEKTFSQLNSKEKKHMLIVGATSIISWVSILLLVWVL